MSESENATFEDYENQPIIPLDLPALSLKKPKIIIYLLKVDGQIVYPKFITWLWKAAAIIT
jgi:hypothetical protein